jgi:NAD(P)-dependent dehydrogenase (short-subunit alcohol dehydrogenase family)
VVSVEGKDMAKTVSGKVQGDERRRTIAEKQFKLYPLAGLGVPEDIANMIVSLASDRTSWITGQSISVDGGILHGVIIYPF